MKAEFINTNGAYFLCVTATVPGIIVLGLLSGGSFLVAQAINFPISVHDKATNLWLLHSIVFKHQLEYSVCGVHTTCLLFLFISTLLA